MWECWLDFECMEFVFLSSVGTLAQPTAKMPWAYLFSKNDIYNINTIESFCKYRLKYFPL